MVNEWTDISSSVEKYDFLRSWGVIGATKPSLLSEVV